MKKALLALAAIGLGAISAYAAGGGLGVFGTYMDTDDLGTAYGGGLKFKFEVADYLAAELRASYVTGFEEDDIEYDNLYVVPVEADLLFNFPLKDTPITVYAGGGGGYYVMPEFEVDGPVGTMDVDFEDSFGFFGVGGVELALGDAVSLFAEAKYLFLEVDEVEIDDVKVEGGGEVKFTGLNANAGLMFRF